MNLENFGKYIDKKQVLKGKDYYESGCIIEMDETDPGKWEGIVAGSDNYHVSVTLNKKQIDACSCDCPHDIDFCKHVIAALYYIQEAISLDEIKPVGKKEKNANKKPKASFKELLRQIPEKELRNFIEIHADKNKEFKQLLTAHFAGYFGEDARKSYSRLLKNAAKAAADRSGFIDYYSSSKAVEPAIQLIQNAEAAFNQEHYSICSDIAFAVVEEVHEMLEDMDDSNGYAGSCIRDGFFLLNKLLDASIPYDLRDRIWGEALKAVQDKKYQFVGFDEDWLALTVKAAHDKTKQDHTLMVIERFLADVDASSKDWSWEYDTVRLLKHKIRLLQNKGELELADKLRLEHLEFSDLRISLIEDKILRNEFDQARQLCCDGIIIAGDKKLPGVIKDYKVILLRIAQQQNNIMQVRQIANELYGGRDMAFYRVLKNTYSTDEWPAIVNELVEKLETFSGEKHMPVGYTVNAENLAMIYIEECRWPQLIDLLQRNPSLHFLETFSRYLEKRWLPELMTTYQTAFTNHLNQHTGRNHYIHVREILEKILHWDGGKERVREIILQLSSQFKARKALMEELGKIEGDFLTSSLIPD